MEIIFGTYDNYTANVLKNQLSQGAELAEQINADDDECFNQIQEAKSLVLNDHPKFVNENNELIQSKQTELMELLTQFFNQTYFDFEFDKYFVKVTQKANALQTQKDDYLKALADAKEITNILNVALTSNAMFDQLTKARDIAKKQNNQKVLNLLKQNHVRHVLDLLIGDADSPEYSDALLDVDTIDDKNNIMMLFDRYSKDMLNSRLSSKTKTWFIFPQLTGNFSA